MHDPRIEVLRARQNELLEDQQAIIAIADQEKRELSSDEQKQLDEFAADFDKVGSEIARRERVVAQANEMNAGPGRKTEAAPLDGAGDDDGGDDEEGAAPVVRPSRPQAAVRRPNPGPDQRPRVEGGHHASRQDVGRYGFRSFGEFASSVRRASVQAGTFDPRLENCLRAAATTFGNESVGEQGGFLVPPEFRTEIMQKVLGEDTLLARTDQMTSGSNTFTFPKDETTPWQTSGGVQAFWDGEGQTINQSRPLLEQSTLRLNRLTALVPVTEELLEDSSGLDGYLRRKAPEKMNFKINLAIVQGTGAGQPLGILNSPALVTVTEESGQAADSVVFGNIQQMWSRLYAPSRSRAIWLVNQDVETALMAMSFPGTGTAVPVYMPPGGLRDTPFATLLGRPVVPTEACNTIGDAGDIILADLTQYMTVRKTSGVRIDTSMHLYFDQAMTAFRFIFRVGGAPWWSAPIARRAGDNTLSFAVALAERS